MMLRFLCIGAGNMGEAILRGAYAAGALQGCETSVYDPDEQKTALLHTDLGIRAENSFEGAVKAADVVLLAVKPNVCDAILRSDSALFAGKAILSIVAGRSGKALHDRLPEDARVLRVMPNTPAMVGEGMIVFEDGDTLSAEETAFAKSLFSAVGKLDHAPAHLMHAVTGVSGSGPAYVYMFIEAMADAGVQAGLPRAAAYRLAAQTVLGSAKMVLETGEHPGVLKDRVCSPGGTTIDAVAALEADGFRHAVIHAIDACVKKSEDLAK